MNPGTGAIAMFETTFDAVDAGYTLPLTDDQHKTLSGMNRRERRRQAKRMRLQPQTKPLAHKKRKNGKR